MAGPASGSSSKPARGLITRTQSHPVSHSHSHSHSHSLTLFTTHSLTHSLTFGSQPLKPRQCRAGNSLDSKDSALAQPLRFNSRIQSVKNAVADLRVSVKGAIAYREKCSLTLSAAMGATLALEQVLKTSY